MQPDEILAFLKTIPEFEHLPEEQLVWLAAESDLVSFPTGIMFSAGEEVDGMFIVVTGRILVRSTQNNQSRVMMELGPRSLTGLLPFSRMKTAPVTTELVEPTTALFLHKSKHPLMAHQNYELTAALVHVLSDRVRLFTGLHFQNEKLMSLGKLSAGLAHELNNPASALLRSAEEMQQQIAEIPTTFVGVIESGLSVAELNKLKPLIETALLATESRLPLLERKRREDDIINWLEEHNVADDAGEVFVEYGLTCSQLDKLTEHVADCSRSAFIAWLANMMQAKKASREMGTAARRISELVQSVKSYTRMDQVHDRQNTQINDGIRNTIVMLQHKARKNNIEIHDDLPQDLPEILAFPGELNQVWTNIIDNALDAMKDGGTLSVRTFSDHSVVSFQVKDTGPGIPAEHLSRIFDPFFTTKSIGEGTGVGLEIVQTVVRQHNGRIDVESEPGNTVFTVTFPVAHAESDSRVPLIAPANVPSPANAAPTV